ncbi:MULTISPECIES: YbfB/YjiJ family MFS transporter [Paraburkholderia]|jgi:predicted MFS family arabinose efflux permease|uniref:YbfB/YjiJ family MFS transporter n=1 Tax=Paraburkholderia TaxID=1822464 RepID=UPI00034D9B2F|nr:MULTISPECIES: YbfB/YjiJ family MFS transporter [Paraburkholderia]WEY42606.1 YbfB/YjiJ family MFS transporter [Paraburkholderia sp. SUR17]
MDYAATKGRAAGAASFNLWRGTVAGASASLVGIGLARFAYTPLLPAIIGAHWFDASTAAYLGAANLGGYLAGALAARALAKQFPAAWVLRAMMALVTVAFVACALPVSFLWFFLWRLASGVSGGVLMVMAAPTILAHVPPSRRGFTSGAIFTGIGLGIAASGTIVPLLLHQGLTQTWLGLAAVSLVLTVVAWNGWPHEEPTVHASTATHNPHAAHKAPPVRGLRALYAGYGLNAVGLVPHMIFLVDYVARGLGKGVDGGAQYWVLYGLGAMVGPLVSGHLADRAGFARALRIAYGVQMIAVALPLLGLGPVPLMISSVVMGAFAPGIVPIVLGRVNEMLAHHPAAQKGAWSKATTSFAVMQAVAAYGLSFLFSRTGGGYAMLFAIGAVALVLALALDLIVTEKAK